jgi:hypothetical protein
MTYASPSRLVLVAVTASALLLAGCSGAVSETSSSPSASSAPEPSFEPGVYAIECNSAASARASAVQLLGPNVYAMGGWSHLTGVGQFANAALSVGDYRITSDNYVPDPTCADHKTLSVVLVKKTWDWDRNHANGMESAFPQEHVTFGDVTDITLEMRLVAERTSIPSADALAASYGDVLTAGQLAQLDNQMVNLEVILFGQGATADRPFMNASAAVSVDPTEFADGWVRVKIPREDFEWYTEDNYVRTPVDADEHQGLAVQGLRINPETSSGLTARHFMGDNFDPSARAELFKEMGLAFALIGVGGAG